MLFVIVTMMISALCVVFNFYDNVSALCVSFDCSIIMTARSVVFHCYDDD